MIRVVGKDHPRGVCCGTDPGGRTGVLLPLSGGGTLMSSPMLGGRSTPRQLASDSLSLLSAAAVGCP